MEQRISTRFFISPVYHGLQKIRQWPPHGGPLPPSWRVGRRAAAAVICMPNQAPPVGPLAGASCGTRAEALRSERPAAARCG